LADKVEIAITDLSKKHPGKPAYKGFYSLIKRTYQDDGEITSDGFAIDKENLLTLRAKIMAILIDELPPKDTKFKSSSNTSKQTKL
jgi:hypothetical protein